MPIEMMPPNQNPKYATGLIPLKSAPACWGSGPHLMCGSFGPHRSTPQTGARSVQPFLQDLWLQRTHRHIGSVFLIVDSLLLFVMCTVTLQRLRDSVTQIYTFIIIIIIIIIITDHATCCNAPRLALVLVTWVKNAHVFFTPNINLVQKRTQQENVSTLKYTICVVYLYFQ